jgi:hypothetical protein
MAGAKSDYRLGRIISCFLLGRNGKREQHPAVIISPDIEIIQPEKFDPREAGGMVKDNLVAVLGISTKYRNFQDPYIPLPVGPQTQLTENCAVILNWIATPAIPDDCEFLLGDVAPALMVRINVEYRRLLKDVLSKVEGTLAETLNALAQQRTRPNRRRE